MTTTIPPTPLQPSTTMWAPPEVTAKTAKDQREGGRMRRWIVLVLSSAALAGAGCGALPAGRSTGAAVLRGGTGPVVPSPGRPDPKPAPTGRTLTAADSGATVVLRRGVRIAVALGPGWDRPRTYGDRVLRLLSAHGGYPSSAPLRATYVAFAPGRTEIRTQTDLACFHTRPPCKVPVHLWWVRVVVSGTSGRPGPPGRVPVR